MVSLNIELSEELFAAMHKDKTEMIRDIRLAAAVKFFERGMISQERAAELAGMSRAKFIYSLKEFSVSPFQYTSEEIIAEVDNYLNV